MKQFTLFALSISLVVTQLKADTCLFCNPDVIKRPKVLETEHFNVLLDPKPRVPGHLIVIPKKHAVKANELSPTEWSEMGEIIPKITEVFTKFLGTSDYIILQKNGRNAFQQVPHAHFHLIPVHSESWSDIFDFVPDKLPQQDFDRQVTLFREYFISPSA